MFRTVRARPAERTRQLPGDELLPAEASSLTHAITIRRPPHDVWPWLVQMGAGRAGWYSYDFIDNGRHPSAKRIIPELQRVEKGNIFPAMPGVTDGFTVLGVDPERSLILGWVPRPGSPPMTTWAFVLEEPEPGSTRLIVRARARPGYRPPFGLPLWTVNNLVQWGHATMQRKQLLGIAQRAEATPVGASRGTGGVRRIVKQIAPRCCELEEQAAAPKRLHEDVFTAESAFFRAPRCKFCVPD